MLLSTDRSVFNVAELGYSAWTISVVYCPSHTAVFLSYLHETVVLLICVTSHTAVFRSYCPPLLLLCSTRIDSRTEYKYIAFGSYNICGSEIMKKAKTERCLIGFLGVA